MNYINRLEAVNADQASEISRLRAGIVELESYLTSSKFESDNTVQCRDVLIRLREVLTS